MFNRFHSTLFLITTVALLLFVTPVAYSQETEQSSPLADIEVAFELQNRDGELVSHRNFNGQHVLLAFGFTHCAHICPMMAASMASVLKRTERAAVGIFVSVDTERDSRAITDDYASAFGASMLGLGGTFDQVTKSAAHFKVSFVITRTQSTYTVEHTPNIYLISPEGLLLLV